MAMTRPSVTIQKKKKKMALYQNDEDGSTGQGPSEKPENMIDQMRKVAEVN